MSNVEFQTLVNAMKTAYARSKVSDSEEDAKLFQTLKSQVEGRLSHMDKLFANMNAYLNYTVDKHGKTSELEDLQHQLKTIKKDSSTVNDEYETTMKTEEDKPITISSLYPRLAMLGAATAAAIVLATR